MGDRLGTPGAVGFFLEVRLKSVAGWRDHAHVKYRAMVLFSFQWQGGGTMLTSSIGPWYFFSFQWQGGGTMLTSSIGPWYFFHFSGRVADRTHALADVGRREALSLHSELGYFISLGRG